MDGSHKDRQDLFCIIVGNTSSDDHDHGLYVICCSKSMTRMVSIVSVSCRLALRKGSKDKRVCKIQFSPLLPELEATFSIAIGGIFDCAKD